MNRDDYVARGVAFERAWDTLEAACEIPPSVEVFVCELREMRENPSHPRYDPGISPLKAAVTIGRLYQRIPI